MPFRRQLNSTNLRHNSAAKQLACKSNTTASIAEIRVGSTFDTAEE